MSAAAWPRLLPPRARATTGDRERLGRAALILCSGGGTSDATVDPELVGILEEALAALGDEPSGLRARLLSSLAAELQWGPEAERRMRLAREALTLARETRDPDALNLVLRRSWTLIDGSLPYHAELEPLLDEGEAVAREVGDPAAVADAASHEGVFSLGYAATATRSARHLGEAARIKDGLRRPLLNYNTRNDEAALAAYLGQLDRAEELATEAMELGRLANFSDAAIFGFFGAIIYLVRQGQGRLGELVPLLEDRVAELPDVPVWRMALAGALAETARFDDGARAFRLAGRRRLRQGAARRRVRHNDLGARVHDV